MQTKLGSFAEAWANIAVGFGINFSANLIFLPLFGFDSLTAGKAFGIGLIFTGISLVRSYVLRRWFNGLKFGNVVLEREPITYNGPPNCDGCNASVESPEGNPRVAS